MTDGMDPRGAGVTPAPHHGPSRFFPSRAGSTSNGRRSPRRSSSHRPPGPSRSRPGQARALLRPPGSSGRGRRRRAGSWRPCQLRRPRPRPGTLRRWEEAESCSWWLAMEPFTISARAATGRPAETRMFGMASSPLAHNAGRDTPPGAIETSFTMVDGLGIGQLAAPKGYYNFPYAVPAPSCRLEVPAMATPACVCAGEAAAASNAARKSAAAVNLA